MRLSRLRSLAVIAVLGALPLSAQVGGPYSGADAFAPAAVPGASRLHIVANEGTPGQQQLIYTSVGTNGFTKVEVLGRRTSGAALAYDADGLHVFVVDTTGRLSHRLRSAAGAWGNWSVVPRSSRLRGRPATASFGGVIYVFVIGGDGNIWYTTGSKEAFGTRWTRLPDFKTLQSPTAMADGKRLMVVGINPNTSLGLYQQFSDGKWSAVRGLYTDPANAPKGPLMVAAGDRDDSIWLASAISIPANTMMVADAFASMPDSYDGEQLDAILMAPPAMFRAVNGHLALLVRSAGDKLLWYRELVNDQWSNWSKVTPPR